MPAAAVIPAPRAYIRVVAVKTCVVEVEGCRSLEPVPCGRASLRCSPYSPARRRRFRPLSLTGWAAGDLPRTNERA